MASCMASLSVRGDERRNLWGPLAIGDVNRRLDTGHDARNARQVRGFQSESTAK
jgi:hypothetical protein